MVTKHVFCHKIFWIFKNGQKKCPKSIFQNTFPNKKSSSVSSYEGTILGAKMQQYSTLCRESIVFFLLQ